MSGRSAAGAAVEELLTEAEEGSTRLYLSAINAGEVYYFLRKNNNGSLAESWRESCNTLPATLEVPTGAEIWDAASLKARFPIAYADAFAAALAQKYKCPLVTGDPEFHTITSLALDWIGRKS